MSIDDYDDDVFDDLCDEDEFCGICEEDLSDYSSHYHCSNCEEVTGMLGHYNFTADAFTCTPS